MKQKLFMAFAAVMLSMGMALAQTSTVQGVVTSTEDGQPIIGASVLVKGTSLGTITNIDGEFTISNVPASSTLIVSFIGMKSKEVAASSRVNVALDPDNQVLDEVVVTALGLSREKKSLGYAVQEVKAEELTQSSQLNLGNALQGRVAGVQITQAGGAVGSSQRILIRGNSSFGSNDPLIVIDGVPMDASSTSANGDGTGGGTLDTGTGLNDLNPDDIESISVLKGGSAALYGMRAGNGVILITTKKGSDAKGKLTVNYDGSFTVDRVYHLPSYQNKYGQGYAGSEYDWKLAQQKGYTGDYAAYAQEYGFSYLDGDGSGVNDNDDESWGPRLDIGLKIPQFNSPVVSGVRQATEWKSNPDNIKDFFQTGFSTSHNLSIANANDKGSYRASLGYRDQKGTVWNTDQKKYNVSLSGNYNFNKYISTDVSMTYSATRSDNLMASGYSSGNPLQSIMQWFGRQVDMQDLKRNMDNLDVFGRYYNWNSTYHVNPYFNLKNNTNSYDRDRVIAKGSIFVKPTSYLKFEGRLGYDMYYDKTFQKALYSTDVPNGWFRETNEKRTELNADFIAYFTKSWGKFSLDALAGANYRDMVYHLNAEGASDANGLAIPGLYTMSNVLGTPYTSMDNSHIRSNSVYANASLGWNSQLFLEASARNDWSSTIKKSFFYPSVSLSWIPTETFQSLKSDFLSYLKIRGNFAKIGNATSAYRTGNYFTSPGVTIGGTTQFYRSTTLPNANLKPEKILTRELGIEAAFWQNRIRLDLALYSKTTSDQIMSVEVPTSTGYRYSLINAGKISNKGLEISISADIIKNLNGFSWTSTLNWSKDKSKIIELANGLDTYTINSSWSVYNYAKVGESWGTLVGTQMRRDDQGNVIVNSSGTPIYDNGKVLGHVTPDWLAGWNNEISYKDLSLGFLLDYRKGGDFFSVSQMFNTYTGILDYTAAGDIRERGIVLGKDVATEYTFVKQDGSKNDIEISAYDWFSKFYSIKELSVNDGSYLKLREMHLTYSLPKKLLAKTNWIQGAKISLVGNNLAILWLSSRNKAKIDPESTEGSDNASVGFEANSVPPTRSIGLKVNLTF